MAAPLLSLREIDLTFGGTPLLEGTELSVFEGDRLCLVGRNGSGKSTLLKIAAGQIEPDRGERVAQLGATIRYLPQEPDMTGFASIEAYVLAGLAPGDDPNRAIALIDQVGLDGSASPTNLSGGEARRAAIARTLAPAPDLLLLDEPTNHLDLPMIEWLERELAQTNSALVLISHDRRFLEKLTRATVWLDRGKTRRLNQGFAAFENWRDETLENEQTAQHKLERRIIAEEKWLYYGGVTARRKRNQGRVRALNEMRTTRREARSQTGNVNLQVTEGESSGKLVIETIGVGKSYDGRPIISNLSLRIARGDRLGIIGANGTGKTTLLKLLTGELAPDAGSVRQGANLQVLTLDQKRNRLAPNDTLQEVLTGGRGDQVTVGGKTKHVVSYMKDFLFSPEQARTPVSRLSGGERGRLMLARALSQPSNLLVLDEPTNDLDMETLDLLEEMLADYAGTVLLVGHDRDFLDRVVGSVVVHEGEGCWVEYAGGYSDMVAQRGYGVTRSGLAEEGSRSARSAQKRGAERPGQQRAPLLADTDTSTASSEQAATALHLPQRKRKFSFKEKHALETLPDRIEKHMSEITRLEAVIADTGLYTRDPKAFQAALTALETARANLAKAEEDWLELELLREQIGG